MAVVCGAGDVTATNTSVGLAAALVLSADARGLLILLVPALSAFALYRAYVSEQRRGERLKFLLYEANRVLAHSRRVVQAIEGVLPWALHTFLSEIAEVILSDADGVALRTTHGPGPERATMQPADPPIAEALANLVDRSSPVVSLAPPFPNDVLRAHFEQRGIRHAMVAPLPSPERPPRGVSPAILGMLPSTEHPLGTIMLANRSALERGYAPDDLRWLEALANTASLAIRATSRP